MELKRVVYTHEDLHGRYKPMGRMSEESDGLLLSWSASGLSFTCTASRLVFLFAPCTGEQPVSVCLKIDHYSYRYALDGKMPVIVCDNLDEVPHTVTLLRLSEGHDGLFLRSLELWGQAPALLLPAAASDRRLLFIGDSLTCGYGTDSMHGDTVFRTWEENATHAYPFRCAAALSADYQIVSVSGQGLTQDCNGEHGTLFSEFWRRPFNGDAAAGKTEQTGFVPHAVIINGGTNDENGGARPDVFAHAARDLLMQIRATYPRAEILWFYGLTATKFIPVLKEVICDLGDPHTVFLEAPRIAADDPQRMGCNTHPTSFAHAGVTPVLVAELRKRLGW